LLPHNYPVNLPPMLIDAHCHLEKATFGDELDQVIGRAEAAGLVNLIAVGASGVAAGADEALALTERYPHIFAAVGIHPHEAQAAHDEPAAVAHIDACLRHPKAVALGEVGLDYYYTQSPVVVQNSVFRTFLRMARAHDKPLMLHIREAHADCYVALDEVGLPSKPGVVHCFTAGVAEAKNYLDRGMYLSIPGVVTFKNAGPLREAVQYAPLDRLLVETDSPYLAPVPHRGKRCEPAFVVQTALAVAALRGIELAEVEQQTTANAQRLFGLPVAAT
jgi:TatD DNase family protein